LREWKTIALRGLPSLFEKRDALTDTITAHDQQVQERSAHIGRLTTQLAWIKKNLVSTLTRSERRALVEPSVAGVSLTAQADILRLRRSSR
jgi:putative transposase